MLLAIICDHHGVREPFVQYFRWRVSETPRSGHYVRFLDKAGIAITVESIVEVNRFVEDGGSLLSSGMSAFQL